MLPLATPLLVLAIAVVALLYAAVGHAGASGYIAVLAMAGAPPALIKPAALVLNLLVACLGSWQYARAGHLRWRRFWPLLVLSVPGAFLGGALDLPTLWFERLVGLVLLASALRFGVEPRDPVQRSQPGPWLLLLSGGALGLLAGLTGTGGGVFLSPLLLLRGWATTREAAAASSLFILVNSAAGLAGLGLVRGGLATDGLLALWPLLPAVLLAGGLGARLGSRHLPVAAIRRLLALVLLVAGLKLLGVGR